MLDFLLTYRWEIFWGAIILVAAVVGFMFWGIMWPMLQEHRQSEKESEKLLQNH